MIQLRALAGLTIYGHKALCTWLNWPAYVSLVMIRPPLYIAFFSGLARYTIGAAAVQATMTGLVVYSAVSLLVGGAIQSLGNEAAFGTMPTFLLARAQVAAYLTKGLALLPSGIACYGVGVIAALVLGWRLPAASIPAVACCLAAISFSLTYFALCVGNCSVLLSNWIIPMAIVEGLIFSLSGIIIPIEALPAPVRAISEILPVTHGLQALRQALAGGGASDVLGGLMTELGLGCFYAVAGVFALRMTRRYCWLTGTAV